MASPSERSAASHDDDKNEPDELRRQSNRACDFCHRMKMKCIGKENPPCNRCRQSGQQCTFDGPRKSKASKVEDRLKLVEEQMTVVQSSLAELLDLQRAAARGQYDSAPRGVPPTATAYPSHAQHQSTSPAAGRGRGHSFSAQTISHPGPLGLNVGHIQSAHNPYSALTIPRMHDQGGLGMTAPRPSSGHGVDDRSWTSRLSRPVSRERQSPLPESGMQSDDDDDHGLEPSAIIYDNMLSLAEAARLKADGHMDTDTEEMRARRVRKDREGMFDYTVEGDRHSKRKRSSLDSPTLRRALPIQRGDHVHQVQNPMEMGLCTAERGEQLFNIFMDGAAPYVPIFDPAVDTWESLCRRSPFAITALITIGSKIEDAGGPQSELQTKCREHAEDIGMHTLFTPVSRMEVVQAMIVLSSWGDTSWRPGGHAMRIAMDMGLYRCLPYLAETGMGAGKSAAELEEERPLVVGARCWLALYKSELEMVFNLGRPALFAAQETLAHCREFLNHPLSIPTDSRLVATCELLTLRMPLYQPFSIWPSATRVPNLDEMIKDANESFVTWLKYWEDYYINKGVSKTSFLRETLLSQYAHSVLHTNSRILHGVRSRRDVALLSESRLHLLRQALNSAHTLVAMSLRSPTYATNFAKANYYTHVGVAFAARMAIRLTSLIPDGVDLREIGRDLEAVTKILAQVPGFQFAQQIRDILIKARRKHVLPPASKAASPASGSVPLPADTTDAKSPTRSAAGRNGRGNNVLGMPHFQPLTHLPTQPDAHAEGLFPTTTPESIPLDFFYADSLLTGPKLPDIGETPQAAPALLDQVFALDTWFPYPPLETEGALGLESDRPAGGLYWQGSDQY